MVRLIKIITLSSLTIIRVRKMKFKLEIINPNIFELATQEQWLISNCEFKL